MNYTFLIIVVAALGGFIIAQVVMSVFGPNLQSLIVTILLSAGWGLVTPSLIGTVLRWLDTVL